MTARAYREHIARITPYIPEPGANADFLQRVVLFSYAYQHGMLEAK
jgi:hypothetical protein